MGVINKIFCDMCGKEVESFSDLENIVCDTKSGSRYRYEVCRECHKKILDYIWRGGHTNDSNT